MVGHNDMPLVDLISPPLTTIRIGHREMGRGAAKLLLKEIDHRDRTAQHVILQPELIVRASTKRCECAPKNTSLIAIMGFGTFSRGSKTWPMNKPHLPDRI